VVSYRSVGSVTIFRSNGLVQDDHEKSLHRTNGSQITRHCCIYKGQTVKHLRGYWVIILYESYRLPVRVLFRRTVSADLIGYCMLRLKERDSLCACVCVCVCVSCQVTRHFTLFQMAGSVYKKEIGRLAQRVG